MEQKQNCCGLIYDKLPPLSLNYPWFVAQNGEEDTEVQILFTAQDPFCHYHCRIPELLGKHIWGSFHGWLVLSTGIMWSLWNPMASKIISLPPLILKDGDANSIEECCLSSPPNDANSILLLTIADKYIFVFCKVNSQGESLSWTRISYYDQVMKINGGNHESGYLCPIIYSNGKVYAQTLGGGYVLQVAIEVKGREVEINLLPNSQLPLPSFIDCYVSRHYLRGSITGLFDIVLGFKDCSYNTVSAVQLFKLDMSSMKWEEIKDLKETILSISHNSFYSEIYSHAIASSDLGGYIHIIGDKGKTINSYHVKDKTISLSSTMPCLVGTQNVSAWPLLECRLEAHHVDHKQKEEDKDAEIVARLVKDDEVEFNSRTNDECHLLNLPFHIVEMIMKFCVGVEYLKFRATCKCCHLAAPLVKWINEESLERLQTYSVSPWMIVFDKHQGIITLTDPMFGDKYYIKTPKQLISDIRMYDSNHGWLLMHVKEGPPVFYNPFTSDIRKLPSVPFLVSLSFSAPPTSPDCIVFGFTAYDCEWHVYIHNVARPNWQRTILDFNGVFPYHHSFPTFFDGDLYALCNDGELDVFKDICNDNLSWEIVSDAPTSRCKSEKQCFLMKREQNLLLIIVGKFGESIELFELNDSTEEWEKIDVLGRHTVYISNTGCICTEAQTPLMENKIYFQRLHSESGNLVFYSLETGRYHTSDGKNVGENFGNFFGTKHHMAPLSWIEPSWS